MPKSTLAWNPDEYATVKERVEAFRATYPTGRIVTELHSRSRERVTFRALVYRSTEERDPAATGWASEREGDGEVNAVACLENAETSAVGRALANLGFSASRRRAGDGRAPDVRPADARGAGAPVRLVRETPVVSLTPAGVSVLQEEADALLDVLLLLGTAERAGLAPDRVRSLRGTLTARSVAPSTRQRIERELRDWLLEHQDGTTDRRP